MKEFNKEEYNKMCADLIGWKLTNEDLVFNSFINGVSSSKTFRGYIRKEQKYTRGVPLVVVRGNKKKIDYYREKEMDFTSDWNWIMEVVEKINDRENGISVSIHPNSCLITDTGVRGQLSLDASKNIVRVLDAENNKEAVVQAVWEFLNWYNEQNSK